MDSGLMDIKELSALLSVQECSIRKWVAQVKIPYVKLGRLVRFRRDEIAAWVKAGEVRAYRPDVYEPK